MRLSDSLKPRCSNIKCRSTENVHERILYIGGIYYNLCDKCLKKMLNGLEGGVYFDYNRIDPSISVDLFGRN